MRRTDARSKTAIQIRSDPLAGSAVIAGLVERA
jgi:hypothetical protein